MDWDNGDAVGDGTPNDESAEWNEGDFDEHDADDGSGHEDSHHADDLPDGDDPKRSRHKKKLISQACLSCRRKKIKCSGDHPCKQCAQRGLQSSCQYGAQKKRGPPRGRMEELAKENEKLKKEMEAIKKAQPVRKPCSNCLFDCPCSAHESNYVGTDDIYPIDQSHHLFLHLYRQEIHCTIPFIEDQDYVRYMEYIKSGRAARPRGATPPNGMVQNGVPEWTPDTGDILQIYGALALGAHLAKQQDAGRRYICLLRERCSRSFESATPKSITGLSLLIMALKASGVPSAKLSIYLATAIHMCTLTRVTPHLAMVINFLRLLDLCFRAPGDSVKIGGVLLSINQTLNKDTTVRLDDNEENVPFIHVVNQVMTAFCFSPVLGARQQTNPLASVVETKPAQQGGNEAVDTELEIRKIDKLIHLLHTHRLKVSTEYLTKFSNIAASLPDKSTSRLRESEALARARDAATKQMMLYTMEACLMSKLGRHDLAIAAAEAATRFAVGNPIKTMNGMMEYDDAGFDERYGPFELDGDGRRISDAAHHGTRSSNRNKANGHSRRAEYPGVSTQIRCSPLSLLMLSRLARMHLAYRRWNELARDSVVLKELCDIWSFDKGTLQQIVAESDKHQATLSTRLQPEPVSSKAEPASMNVTSPQLVVPSLYPFGGEVKDDVKQQQQQQGSGGLYPAGNHPWNRASHLDSSTVLAAEQTFWNTPYPALPHQHANGSVQSEDDTDGISGSLSHSHNNGDGSVKSYFSEEAEASPHDHHHEVSAALRHLSITKDRPAVVYGPDTEMRSYTQSGPDLAIAAPLQNPPMTLSTPGLMPMVAPNQGVPIIDSADLYGVGYVSSAETFVPKAIPCLNCDCERSCQDLSNH